MGPIGLPGGTSTDGPGGCPANLLDIFGLSDTRFDRIVYVCSVKSNRHMSTTKTTKAPAKTAAKKGANAKGANSTKGANAKGANSRGANSGALKPSEMAKALGLTRVGFNQWKNKDSVVVARTDGKKLAATKKGAELKFDPMAEFAKLNK